MLYKLLLFDLDGTLLRSDKSISLKTLDVIRRCQQQGFLVGVSTSRSEKNSQSFLSDLHPDIVVSSGGALVSYHNEYILREQFTPEQTSQIIKLAKKVCGRDCEITVDTVDNHYWNYKVDPKQEDASWGDSVYCDFTDFSKAALKICVEIFDSNAVQILKEMLPDCDCVRFSDGNWYKFTVKTATKENAIVCLCEALGISADQIIAFGDDFADIEMLKLCGKGVAMGNAIDEVKAAADITIGTNDNDGIADFLSGAFLKST